MPKTLQGNFLLPICTERLTPSFAHLLLFSLDFKRGCKTLCNLFQTRKLFDLRVTDSRSPLAKFLPVAPQKLVLDPPRCCDSAVENVQRAEGDGGGQRLKKKKNKQKHPAGGGGRFFFGGAELQCVVQ